MKKNFCKLCFTAIVLAIFTNSCGNSNEQPRLAFVSNEVILSDSTLYYWGDVMEGDSAVFSNYKFLPILKNITNIYIDSLYLQANIYGVVDTTEISKYYIIDEVSEEESGSLSVVVHYGKYVLYPYEEIPFPISVINCENENRPIIVEYDYVWCSSTNRYNGHKAIMGIVYHQKSHKSNVGPDNPQKSFLYYCQPMLNWKNPTYNTLIFKDTIVHRTNNYNLLKEKEINIDKIIDLQ